MVKNSNRKENIERVNIVGYWRWNFLKKEGSWSDNFYEIFEWDKDKELSFDIYTENIHPDDIVVFLKKIKEVNSNRQLSPLSHRFILKSGKIKTVFLAGQALTDKQGDVVEIIGTCQEINDPKEITEFSHKKQFNDVNCDAEKEFKTAELKLKNQQLKIAEKMAMIGSWQWDLKTDEIKWSDNLYTIYGHEKSDPITLEVYKNYIHDDDKNYVASIFEETFQTKVFKNSTHKIQLKNGSVKVLNSIGKVITDKDGDIIKMLGICQDITKKKADELELLQKNESLSFAEEITKIGNWKWDVKTNKYEWSDNLYKIVGFEIGTTITKQKYLSRVPVEDQKLWQKHIDTSLENKSFEKIVHCLIRPDKTLITLEVNGKVLTDDEGNITAIFGTSQDITERVKKEVELIEKNQQLNLAEEIAMVGCWVLDLKTEKFDWSDGTYKMFDFDLGTFVNIETLFACIPEEEHQAIRILMKKFERTKVFEKFTHSIKHRDGSLRKVEVLGKVVTSEENEAIEFIGSTRDITEELRVQQEILDANKNLKESTIKLSAINKQLAEFNQISSHNLRAPVGNLNTLLDLYKESKDENEKFEIFDKLDTVVERLTLTLDTLVESLKIKNNPDKILKKLFFNDVLNKTKEILSAEILKTGTVIKSNFKGKESLQYNQIYLESIFLNLIGNAIKYSSPDRGSEITITSNLVDEKITLEIKDNGLGIDLEKHGHKLFGLNKVFHRHPESKGVGLFLTKAQIETMGGSIYAKSYVNIGTTFYITLN